MDTYYEPVDPAINDDEARFWVERHPYCTYPDPETRDSIANSYSRLKWTHVLSLEVDDEYITERDEMRSRLMELFEGIDKVDRGVKCLWVLEWINGGAIRAKILLHTTATATEIESHWPWGKISVEELPIEDASRRWTKVRWVTQRIADYVILEEAGREFGLWGQSIHLRLIRIPPLTPTSSSADVQ